MAKLYVLNVMMQCGVKTIGVRCSKPRHVDPKASVQRTIHDDDENTQLECLISIQLQRAMLYSHVMHNKLPSE